MGTLRPVATILWQPMWNQVIKFLVEMLPECDSLKMSSRRPNLVTPDESHRCQCISHLILWPGCSGLLELCHCPRLCSLSHSLCPTQSLHFEAGWHTKKHVNLYTILTLNAHRNTQANTRICNTTYTLLLLLIEFSCLPVKCTRNLHSYFAERLHYAMKVTVLAPASFRVSPV